MFRRCFLSLLLFTVVAVGCEAPVDIAKNDVANWDVGRKVLVFTIPGCEACLRDKPAVARMRHECVAQGVEVIEVDGHRHPELVKQLGVRQYPTYVACEDGVVKGFTTKIKIIFTIIKVIFFVAMFFF